MRIDPRQQDRSRLQSRVMGHESRLGQGAVLEAVRQIRDFAFTRIGLIRVEIVVAETNLLAGANRKGRDDRREPTTG